MQCYKIKAAHYSALDLTSGASGVTSGALDSTSEASGVTSTEPEALIKFPPICPLILTPSPGIITD